MSTSIWRLRRLPMIYQAETSECGLACLAMISGYHGYGVDLNNLRSKLGSSALGSSAKQLLQQASKIRLRSRAIKFELEDLGKINLPAVLHWDMDHFVVLKKVRGNAVCIHDPAAGMREYKFSELTFHLTGIALEFYPQSDFRAQEDNTRATALTLERLFNGIGLRAGSLALVFCLTLFIQLLALLNPLYLQLVIDQGLIKGDTGLVLMLALLFIVLILLRTALTQMRGVHLMQFGNQIGFQLVTNSAEHLLSLPVSYFERRELGDIVSRFGSLENIRRLVTQEMVTAIVDGLFSLLTLALLYLYSPLLASVVLSAVVFFSGIRVLCISPERELRKESLVASAKQQTRFMENIRTVETAKVNALEKTRLADWENSYVQQINSGYKLEVFQLSLGSIQAVIFGFENILTIYFGAGAVISGAMTLGQLMSFIFLKQHFTNSMLAMLPKLSEMRMINLELERIGDIACQQPEADDRHLALLPSSVEGDIQLQDLHFTYPGATNPTIHELNYTFSSGECTLVSGQTGSGKSTLLKLLLKLEQAQKGKILLGGRDLALIDRHELRTNSSAVLHTDGLVAGDLAYNIHMGVPSVDWNRLEALCADLGVTELINQLPLGYSTEIGELGSILSAGQVQRILLARALFREPKLLLLDEALSHLNIEAAQNLLHTLETTGITTILVTHNPQLLARASRKLILN